MSRPIIKYIASFLVFLLVGSMANAVPKKQTQAITVQLSWKHQFEYAAFYAAIEKGFYRDAGLTVTLLEGGPGIDSVASVLSKTANVGIANSSLVIHRAQGEPVVALAALMQHSAIAIIARRDLGIENVHDLSGVDISCAAHACSEIKAYLLKSGLPLEQIKLDNQQALGLDQIQNGKFLAAEIFTSNQQYLIRGNEHKYIILTPRSAGIDLFGDILFTTSEMVDLHPAVIERFRQATLKGLTYAFQNIDEIVELIRARYNTQNKTREHLRYEAKKLYDLNRTDLVDVGYMGVGRWEHVVSTYSDLDLMPSSIDLNDFIYDPYSKFSSIPTWVYVSLAILLILSFSALYISFIIRGKNQRLTFEMHERRQAEETLKTKQQEFCKFVEDANTMLSHELRTPLSTIKIHLDILNLKSPNKHKLKTNLEVINAAAMRLENLLEEQLFQIFSSQKFVSSINKINLAKEFCLIIDDFKKQNPKILIEKSIEEDAQFDVLAITDMVKTAMFNMLDNARKYSVQNTTIRVKLFQTHTSSVISVENKIEYLLPDNLNFLFEKGYRGYNGDNIPGNGVGLHLIKLIATAHGGYAEINSMSKGYFQILFAIPKANDSVGGK